LYCLGDPKKKETRFAAWYPIDGPHYRQMTTLSYLKCFRRTIFSRNCLHTRSATLV